MLAKGCPLCFSKDVLAEIFCNVRGWVDASGEYIVVRAKTMINILGHLHKVFSQRKYFF